MTLLLRAIVAAADAPAGAAPGLVVAHGIRVSALASPWRGEATATEADLLEHHRIVQDIFERVPCIPARFGGVFADASALAVRLRERDAPLAERLAAIGDRCELAITCAWRDGARETPTEPVPVTSGRAYLQRAVDRSRARAARERRAAEIAERLLARLGIERGYVRHETCPRPTVAVSMSALVTRDEIAEIRSRLEQLGARLSDVTTIVQGPWAPYSFAVTE